MMFLPSELEQKYLKMFNKKKDLESFLNCFSVYVWENMKFNSENNHRISKVDETELTNVFIRTSAKLIKEKEGLPIRLFHSKRENINGSDLEIFIELKNEKFIPFVCQAKRLYFNSAEPYYNEIKKEQLDKLINYAEKYPNNKKAFPLYMLYNYFDKHKDKHEAGCSLLSAYFLKSKINTNSKLGFKDLNPPARPISSIFELTKKEQNVIIEALKKEWGQSDISEDIKQYIHTENEINKGMKELGIPITGKKSRGTNSEELINVNELLENGSKSLFRIVFTQNNIRERNINFTM